MFCDECFHEVNSSQQHHHNNNALYGLQLCGEYSQAINSSQRIDNHHNNKYIKIEYCDGVGDDGFREVNHTTTANTKKQSQQIYLFGICWTSMSRPFRLEASPDIHFPFEFSRECRRKSCIAAFPLHKEE